MSWPDGWVSFDEAAGDRRSELAESFDVELQREIGPDHPLFQRPARAIAKRDANDEVLFELDSGQLALVHLTWARHPEPVPWPTTALYTSFDEFFAAALRDADG